MVPVAELRSELRLSGLVWFGFKLGEKEWFLKIIGVI